MCSYEAMLNNHKKQFGNNFVIFVKSRDENAKGMYDVISNINDGVEFKKMCDDLDLKFLKFSESSNFFICGVIVFNNFEYYIKRTDYPVFVYNYNGSCEYELVEEHNTWNII